MKESDIVYQNDYHFIMKQTKAYVVFKPCSASFAASESDSSYALDADGLGIAIARCDYLQKRECIGGNK